MNIISFVYRLNDDEKKVLNTLTIEQMNTLFDISRIRFVIEGGMITGIEL